jgi:predicted Zn-dependent protease
MVAKTFKIGIIFAAALFSGISELEARKDFPKGMNLYDAQMNSILKKLLGPLVEKANLDIKKIRLNIFVDPAYNAFATNDLYFGLNTEFLRQSKTVESFLGVMAHEIGHVKCGHVAIRGDDYGKIAKQGMIVTGLAAAVAAAAVVATSSNKNDNPATSCPSCSGSSVGSSAAGAAAGILLGGMNATMRSILSYTRAQESAADQAAIDFLKSLNWPVAGFKESFLTMKDLTTLYGKDAPNNYLSSHPLTPDRISYIDSALNTASSPSVPGDYKKLWATLQIKLKAFLDDPDVVLQELEGQNTQDALIGKAIAYWRQEDLDKAIACADQLIAMSPDNPHYHDLKSDFSWDAGRIEVSRDECDKARKLDKDEPLFQLHYARALVELKQNLAEAAKILEGIAVDNRRFGESWKYLAQVYGLQNRQGEFNWAQAEYSLLSGKVDAADTYAKKAEDLLDKKSKQYTFLQVLKVKIADEKRK